jgi:hypothetical protein
MDTLEAVQRIEAAMIHDNWYHDVSEIIEKYVDERVEQKIKEIFSRSAIDSLPRWDVKIVPCKDITTNDA